MEDGMVQLQPQLHKLSCIKNEETLERVLCTLWNTRKTGLRSHDKSHFQSLLHLPSLSELDPVVACLRWLIRKCVYQNFSGDELLKLFPSDLPLDLQSILLLSFQKNQDRWKEDISREQDLLPITPVSYQVGTDVPPSSDMSTSMWPRQDDDSLATMNHNDFADENLPCLKSMTWTMETRGSSPADRVAIISLKLHDYSKSTSGETEVKFQLTRDTLEAMLRSMTYISEQLSAVGTSSGPANKKQKQ
ncbi:uncharacterized protein LOC133294299 isoform X2 [Gastrolobium bilobum]|uniref:uncharacterized protein LOC133294299 isoform X2 n=1 Tax=Gastrolobium bilobum TaxID=150636 RepID=UPI002AB163CA|nr:uncharacterized protein LOC133294299 isoform X2 [Gastrolobium bilobum]